MWQKKYLISSKMCTFNAYPSIDVTKPPDWPLNASSAFSAEYKPRGVLYCASDTTPSPGPARSGGVCGSYFGAGGL